MRVREKNKKDKHGNREIRTPASFEIVIEGITPIRYESLSTTADY